MTFSVEAEPESEVAVAGTFNDWQPMKLTCKQKEANAKFSRMMSG